MLVAEGPAFVLLAEQGPLSWPWVTQRAGGEPELEHSWADKVPAALDVLPQDISATTEDAATAGKELQAGPEGWNSSSDIPGEREW